MVDPIKPTRQELTQVSNGNNRLLRAFERLFEVSGEKTPDELRATQGDVLAIQTELAGNIGASYVLQDNTIETAISSPSTPVKVEGTTTPVIGAAGFNVTTDNRAIYTGSTQRAFEVNGVCTIASPFLDAANVYIAKNEAIVVASKFHAPRAVSASVLYNIPIFTYLELEPNDFIEVFVENITDANNITMSDLALIVNAAR